MLRRLSFLIATIFVPLAVSAAPALAAKHGGGGGSSTPVGNDISWPQCGKSNPSGQAFGIVGVNGGLANNVNGCLATQLDWAAYSSTGSTSQAKTQLYVNTANPGNLGVSDWPTTGATPYSTCDGSDTQACAWQYGWNMAWQDVNTFFKSGANYALIDSNPGSYNWWLDVETGNSWESGTDGQLRNATVLQGMSDYFFSVGSHVGIYSTSYQWGQITGSNNPNNAFSGMPSWIPGARRLSAAQSNCSHPALTPGGIVSVTQYVSCGYDYDYSCR